jgi:CheY-like chemotaxis protein
MTIKNALIVDDSKSARTMLQRLLQKMDIVSLAVESAEEAFIYLENQQPDVIFMDHMMPGMDGIEATQTIKNNPKTQSIPTIMYTSKEGDSYLTLAKSHGASGVLAKPASQKAVMSVINELDNTAANDVPEIETAADNSGLTLETIEKMINSRFNNSILEAKAEITAGLDGVSHQLSQTHQEQLTIVERNLKQQVKTLQGQLLELQDSDVLFKRLESKIQRSTIQIANKISQKRIDRLVKELDRKLEMLEEQQKQLIKEIEKKSYLAMMKGSLNGAILGALIAITASYIL